jgi:hypothetical protein
MMRKVNVKHSLLSSRLLRCVGLASAMNGSEQFTPKFYVLYRDGFQAPFNSVCGCCTHVKQQGIDL